jgi:hypothetical protein
VFVLPQSIYSQFEDNDKNPSTNLKLVGCKPGFQNLNAKMEASSTAMPKNWLSKIVLAEETLLPVVEGAPVVETTPVVEATAVVEAPPVVPVAVYKENGKLQNTQKDTVTNTYTTLCGLISGPCRVLGNIRQKRGRSFIRRVSFLKKSYKDHIKHFSPYNRVHYILCTVVRFTPGWHNVVKK